MLFALYLKKILLRSWLMRNLIQRFCLAIPFCMLAQIAVADSKSSLHYREDTHTLIPAEVILGKSSTITAPIGDNGLQSPILKLKINGQGPFLFMFDSGFSQSMISRQLANKLNLPIVEGKNVKSVTPNQVVDKFQ